MRHDTIGVSAFSIRNSSTTIDIPTGDGQFSLLLRVTAQHGAGILLQLFDPMFTLVWSHYLVGEGGESIIGAFSELE